MLGTFVNAAAIIAGSLLGILLKGGLKENLRTIMTQAVSMAVVFVGISSCLRNMLADGSHPILFILSLTLGGILGELLGIERRLESVGRWLQTKMKQDNSTDTVAKGFVAASLIFCTGTMAVLGSIESGINGNHSILFAKSLLDGVISLVMASTLGVGVAFSAASVFAYQGALTLAAGLLGPFLTADMLREIGIIGGILITCIGLNMLEITKIRTGNLLPALIFPILFYGIIGFFA